LIRAGAAAMLARMSTKPIPDGYAAITPYLIIDGAARAIDFYEDIFGATERMRMPGPNGRVGHAELSIGGSVLMLADPCPEMKAFAPVPGATSPVSLYLYVPDVDATVARAVAAGATLTQPVETKFYGDRSGGIVDPFGHHWHLGTHVEDVSPEEIQRRMAAMKPCGAG
jgi:PhnB protein